jgi:DNA-binding LacI/PurR family transcriptional regulator
MLSNCYYDYSAAGELVAEQIRKFGHRKAAFVSYGEFLGREYQLIAEGLKKKKRGKRTIDILDIPVPASICKLEVITPLLDDALKKGYTFFFAQSEEHCLLIKQWAELQKVAIPEDISLMYLDYDKMAEQFRPDATAVVCPFQEILKSVADEMVCKIEHRSLDGKVFYPYIRDRNTLASAKGKRKSALKQSGK